MICVIYIIKLFFMRNMTRLLKNTPFSIKSHLFNESQGKRQIYSMFKFKKGKHLVCLSKSPGS